MHVIPRQDNERCGYSFDSDAYAYKEIKKFIL